MSPTQTHLALILRVPAALEEAIEGLLLENDAAAAAGFVSRDVRFHGDAAAYQTIIEQVRGYTRMVEITIGLPEVEIRALLASLRETFPGRGLTFHVVPIVEAGPIG